MSKKVPLLRRIYKTTVALTLAAVFLLTGALPGLASAATLSRDSPNPVDSGPEDGAHVFFLRKSGSGAGQQQDVRLRLYYNSVNDYNASLFRIMQDGTTSSAANTTGDLDCSTGQNSLGANSGFITVTLEGQGSVSYNINKQNVCKGGGTNSQSGTSTNKLYSSYPLPRIPNSKDSDTGLYVVNVTIQYTDTAFGQADLGGIRFTARSGVAGYVGPRGGSGSVSFPIVGRIQTIGTGTKNIKIPFGTCAVGRTGAWKVGIYDSDNGPNGGFPGADVNFRVKNRTTGSYVNLKEDTPTDSNGEYPVNFSDGGTTATPKAGKDGKGNALLAEVTVNQNMPANTKYAMEIYGLYPRNTIDIKIPTDAVAGSSVCKTKQCEEVSPECPTPPTGTDTVVLGASITATVPSVETGATSTTFTGFVNVSNFPKLEDGKGSWGYNEVAKRPDVVNSDLKWVTKDIGTTGILYSGATVTSLVRCGGGAYKTDTDSDKCRDTKTLANPDGHQKYLCADNIDRNNCANASTAEGKKYAWKCKLGNGIVSDSSTGVSFDQETMCPVYEHYCDYPDGTKSAPKKYNFDTTSLSGECYEATCTAPVGHSLPTFTLISHANKGTNDCNIWRCDPNPYTNYLERKSGETDNDLRARLECQAWCMTSPGSPFRPPHRVAYGSDDYNCYVQPKFKLDCYWYRDGVLYQHDWVDAIKDDGKYCERTNFPMPVSSTIGVTMCAQLSAIGTGWGGGIAPGWGLFNWKGQPGHSNVPEPWQYKSWSITPDSAEASCTDVVGKPYVKVYGGDVKVGSGVDWGAGCALKSTARIKAFHHLGERRGSGTQFATFAPAANEGFASSQGSPDPNPIALAFANGGQYGGNWDGPLACMKINDNTSTSAWREAADLPGDPAVTAATQNVRSSGDIVIRGNITYDERDVGSVEKIPHFKVIAARNIYINGDVTRLDGTYIAGGNIYTCASNGSIAGLRPEHCRQQLVINGALVADKVFFWRSCGSLSMSTAGEQSISAGGTDAQNCSGSNHAAEVINYTANQWLEFGDRLDGGYNSIVSLPPVL